MPTGSHQDHTDGRGGTCFDQKRLKNNLFLWNEKPVKSVPKIANNILKNTLNLHWILPDGKQDWHCQRQSKTFDSFSTTAWSFSSTTFLSIICVHCTYQQLFYYCSSNLKNSSVTNVELLMLLLANDGQCITSLVGGTMIWLQPWKSANTWQEWNFMIFY